MVLVCEKENLFVPKLGNAINLTKQDKNFMMALKGLL